MFLSAFHPDAVVAEGDFVGGPDSLCDWAHNLHEQGQLTTHHDLLDNTCEIDGATAHTETYCLLAARNRDRTTWIAGAHQSIDIFVNGSAADDRTDPSYQRPLINHRHLHNLAAPAS